MYSTCDKFMEHLQHRPEQSEGCGREGRKEMIYNILSTVQVGDSKKKKKTKLK